MWMWNCECCILWSDIVIGQSRLRSVVSHCLPLPPPCYLLDIGYIVNGIQATPASNPWKEKEKGLPNAQETHHLLSCSSCSRALSSKAAACGCATRSLLLSRILPMWVRNLGIAVHIPWHGVKDVPGPWRQSYDSCTAVFSMRALCVKVLQCYQAALLCNSPAKLVPVMS